MHMNIMRINIMSGNLVQPPDNSDERTQAPGSKASRP